MGGRLTARGLSALLLAAAIVLGLTGREVRAQGIASSPYMGSYRVSDYFIGPGWYGTSYGFASYGFPQTYSVYTSFPGSSYAANFPPYGLLPARFGVGLWRPGYVAPGYVYGASYYPSSAFSYRTFPVMYGREGRAMDPTPPFGYYAPAFGPGPDLRPRPVYGY